MPEPRTASSTGRDSTPSLIPGVDVWSLPIVPEQAFVLSRIDGRATVIEIAYSTGLPLERVENHLRHLAELGAIAWKGEASREIPNPHKASDTSGAHRIELPPSTSESAPTSPDRKEPSQRPTIPSPGTDVSPAVLFDPQELAEVVDLSAEFKQAVLTTFYQLDTLDHYALLGVPKDADRKLIKSSYYAKAATYHPDRYFGKSLGTYRVKLEKCFDRFTEAHNALTQPEAREEYDNYLKKREETREVERALKTEVTLEDLDRLEQALQHQLALQASTLPPPPSSAAPVSQDRNSPSHREAGARPTISTKPPVLPSDPTIRYAQPETRHESPVPRSLSEAERRRSLARKLNSLHPPNPIGSSSASPSSLDEQRAQAAGDFLKGVASKLKERRGTPSGSFATSPNPIPIMSPEATKAAADLANNYLQQAAYEEKTGRMSQAAASYERAARAAPAPELWLGAARCLLSAGGDLRAAAEFARLAIQLLPHGAEAHSLLARIYLAAGKPNSALTEIERAHQLSPTDDTIRELLDRLRRGRAGT